MAAIASLVQSFGVLKRNPKLFAVGLIFAIVLLPQSALSALGAGLLSVPIQALTFFITPFLLAGLLGMAYEGRVRSTSFDTFKKIGKRRYVSLLIAKFIEFLILLMFGVFAFAIGFITTGASVAAASSPGALESLGLLIFVVFALLFAIFVTLVFFLQFYPAAIVADNVGATDGLRRSYGLVKENIVPSLGYGLINLLVFLATAAPVLFVVFFFFLGVGGSVPGSAAGATALSTPEGAALTAFAGLLGYYLVMSTLLTPFRGAFMMCFYHKHRPAHFE